MANPDKFPVNPPVNKKDRLERLYDLTRMVFADNIADKEEVLLLNRLVIGLGFNAEESSAIAEKALNEVSKGVDEDDFIAAF